MTRFKPKVVRGGRATHIKDNLYYMSGRKHEAGGIDIGKNPRTGLEVEDGEVVQTDSNGLKVFSAQPILNGNSPAKLVMGGANPAKVFNAQERFKEVNGINDDGTLMRCGGRKKEMGGKDKFGQGLANSSKRQLLNRIPKDNKFYINRGDFGGGQGGGGGIGTKIQPYDEFENVIQKDTIYVPVEQTFNDAFRDARLRKDSVFEFQGKKYNTELGDNPNNYAAGQSRVDVGLIPIERTKNVRIKKTNNNNKFKLGGNRSLNVSVNGNVKTGVMYSSSTGGRKKAALGARERDKDYVVMNGKLYRQTNDEFGDTAYEPVDDTIPNERLADGRGSAARKSDREVRAVARRDAKSQTANSRWTRGGNFNEVEPFTPTPSKSTGNSKPKESTNKYDYRIGNKTYKKGDTFEYKGQTYQVSGRNKAVPYNTSSSKPQTSSEVQTAAKRDAKGGRTDFRNMLEIPEFTPDSYSRQSTNNVPTAQTRVTPKETPVKETVQPTATKTSVPQTTNAAPRRRSTNRTSTTPTAAKPTTVQQRTAPNFASLDSMMQGLPTLSRNIPTTIPTRTVDGASTNVGVPDTISSPRKRLALFDKLDTNDIIGLAGNIGGSVASAITTRKALNDMEAPPVPTGIVPARMRTAYNVNDQISDINEEAARMMNDINANTSSGRTRLQRLQRVRNQAMRGRKNLVNTKENIELQLQNEDARNRQSVRAVNVNTMNDWRNRSAQFRNTIREQKASSLNNMFSGINAGLQDMLSRIENRRNYNNTLGIYDATHPNTDKRLFRDKGVTI